MGLGVTCKSQGGWGTNCVSCTSLWAHVRHRVICPCLGFRNFGLSFYLDDLCLWFLVNLAVFLCYFSHLMRRYSNTSILSCLIYLFWSLKFHRRWKSSYVMRLNDYKKSIVVQSLSHVWLFVTLWTTARQASLSFTISRSLLKLMSIESVMPPNHLILCHALLLLTSIFLSIRVFSNESPLCIRWTKYWSFSFCTSP